MNVEVGKSDSPQCVVRIGPLSRSDPDAEIYIVHSTGPGEKDWERVVRKYVEGKKKLKFDLPPGEYHVMLVGDKIVGVANTAGHTLEHPWNVFLEAPQEHAKDYIRRSVPVNRRAENLKECIRKALH